MSRLDNGKVCITWIYARNRCMASGRPRQRKGWLYCVLITSRSSLAAIFKCIICVGMFVSKFPLSLWTPVVLD